MHLTPHSLHQIDDAYLQSWEVEALRGLSMRLLADLQEAWDRLNQGPDNSARPPSSRVPWERTGGARAAAADADADAAEGDRDPEPAERNPEEPTVVAPPVAEAKPASAPAARKAGKQPGAPGIGRTQVFQAHEEQRHYPVVCAGCGRPLARAGAVAYTRFAAVALHWGDAAPPGLAGSERSEWRLVGPGLAALIVALALRFRLSRARIQEFLGAWLGLDLSLGTIHQTSHEEI